MGIRHERVDEGWLREERMFWKKEKCKEKQLQLRKRGREIGIEGRREEREPAIKEEARCAHNTETIQ